MWIAVHRMFGVRFIHLAFEKIIKFAVRILRSKRKAFHNIHVFLSKAQPTG